MRLAMPAAISRASRTNSGDAGTTSVTSSLRVATPATLLRAGWCPGAPVGKNALPMPLNVAVCVKQIPDPATPGKLDPNTGVTTEYPLPDKTAKDPHTINIAQDGTVWFTVQNANMVGRLDPKSGDIKLVTLPQARSQPYGMVMTSDGSPFICEFGANRLAKFDIDTMAITEYTLPNPESRPRRLTITADDVVYYADYSRGYLGMYNLKTKATKEWPSPSGPKSQPYGIVQVNGIIWYNESAIRPNTIVRFDPKTEKFQSWIIPGGGGVVRNMSVFANGNIAMAESGVNRVALVETPKTGNARGTK